MNNKNITKKMAVMFCVSALLLFGNNSYAMILQTLQELNQASQLSNQKPPEYFILRPGEGLPGGSVRLPRDLHTLSLISRVAPNHEWLRTTACMVTPNVELGFGWRTPISTMPYDEIRIARINKDKEVFIILFNSTDQRAVIGSSKYPSRIDAIPDMPLDAKKMQKRLYSLLMEAAHTGVLPYELQGLVQF